MFSLETLQFADLLTLIARGSQTPMGRRRLESLRPRSGKLELEDDLAAVRETQALADEDISWSFSDLVDPSDAVALLRIKNTSLEPSILRELARLISQTVFARTAIQAEKENAPTIWKLVDALPSELSESAERINKVILPSGELDDSASPELNRLRGEINAQRGRLTKTLESVMHSTGNAVQDEIVTVRNGRFVIPVKANFTGKIKGVAHGTSSSGATVFIEPLDSIEANNELQKLKAQEENEISRILFALAEDLRENLPAIEMAVEAVSELDFIKAKVEFARIFQAIVPTITEDSTLELFDARHPLLEESLSSAGRNLKAESKNEDSESGPAGTIAAASEASGGIVPISLTLTEKNPVMIISGANAGGKTVVLKTAGLLSLMAISGLPVPASKARVPFYVSVLADIGDHQSISQNLSTFSSHVSSIADMMKELQPPAIVLLDEVGTGTDPEEGSALGVAIVDYFRRNGAHIIASTHYKGLKIYAANDEDVINASVEFNERTLEPTYRLLTGIAGASSGLEIARRFGIRDDVIETARMNLDAAAQETENYLHKLQKETRHARDLRIALEEERKATAAKYASLDVDFRKKEKRRRRQFETELGETLEKFERKSRAFIKTVEDKKLRKKLENELLANKAELKRQAFDTKAKILGGPSGSPDETGATDVPAAVDLPVETGSRVLLSRFGTEGKVEKIDGDNAQVIVGSMRMRQKLSDLQRIAEQPTRKKDLLEKLQQSARKSGIDPEPGEVQSELNLIGQTTLEAESEVDKFLDNSYVSRLHKVRIIHGFGTGALKNSVHHLLKGHPHVLTFGFAPQNEGGNGATIVELKQ